jgi:hypothetical protein
LRLYSLCNILSDESMGLSFTIAAGPSQRSHSRVRVPRDSLPYFTVSDSRLHQHGGPGPRIYIPQEHGGPVLGPDTRFIFRRFLRLAGLRWRYSTPPQHWRISSFVIFSLYSLGTALTENIASSIFAFWFTAAEMCLTHGCIATSAALPTENTALLLLRAFASLGMYLLSRCLTMNFSGFQASCHNILRHWK